MTTYDPPEPDPMGQELLFWLLILLILLVAIRFFHVV